MLAEKRVVITFASGIEWTATYECTSATSAPGIFDGGDVAVVAQVMSLRASPAVKKAAKFIDACLQNLIVITQSFTIASAQPIGWGDACKIRVEIAGDKEEEDSKMRKRYFCFDRWNEDKKANLC